MRGLAWVALGAVLAGCSSTKSSTTPQASAWVIRTARSSYAIGDSVKVYFWNASGQTLGANLCFGYLERQDGSNWTSVEWASGSIPCLSNIREYPPGIDSITFTLAQGLSAGTYRYRFTALGGALAPDQELSNAFRVAVL